VFAPVTLSDTPPVSPYDVDDPAAAEERTWQIVHDAEVREDERHDEDDDPDQGGTA
jgi:hypothetical protein